MSVEQVARDFIMSMGDKVSRMMVESPADGGIPAAMMQLGVNMSAAM